MIGAISMLVGFASWVWLIRARTPDAGNIALAGVVG